MIPFLYATTVYVAGRLFWRPEASRRGLARPLAAAAVQAALLLAVLRAAPHATVALAAVPPGCALLAAGAEWSTRRRPGVRPALHLAVLALGLALLAWLTRSGLAIRPQVPAAGAWLAAHLTGGNILEASLAAPAWWAHLLGLTASLAEAGLAVQAVLTLLRVAPPPHRFGGSAKIGAIERLLVLVFVFHGAFNAIAFILTAKGVVRFHELSSEGAAEYVLVGTLLSTLSALAIGLLVPLIH
jgi:hypothetical protein